MYTQLLMSSLFLLLAQILQAQTTPVYSNDKGAISGYDPVAYFNKHSAVEGKIEFAWDWQGATWYFSTEENKILFMDNPSAYSPQYGGYCAYAVGNNYTAKSDPEAWKIVDGKLYLNYNKNVQKKWEGKQYEYIRSGDKNWSQMLDE